MTLRVHTARVAYGGPDRFDVTRGSGGAEGAPFAPSWSILNHALDLFKKAKAFRKDGEEGLAESMEESAWREYSPRYVDEMRSSYRVNRAAWTALLARDEVTLVCYCIDGARCHRRLLAEILVKLGAKDEGER
jgi:uncharacterized protein YeaO (DUF488 family)